MPTSYLLYILSDWLASPFEQISCYTRATLLPRIEKDKDWRPRALIGTGCRSRRAAGDSRSGTRACGQADFQACRGDDPGAGRSETPNRDLDARSEEHTSELQSPCNLVCRLLLEKKKQD